MPSTPSDIQADPNDWLASLLKDEIRGVGEGICEAAKGLAADGPEVAATLIHALGESLKANGKFDARDVEMRWNAAMRKIADNARAEFASAKWMDTKIERPRP